MGCRACTADRGADPQVFAPRCCCLPGAGWLAGSLVVAGFLAAAAYDWRCFEARGFGSGTLALLKVAGGAVGVCVGGLGARFTTGGCLVAAGGGSSRKAQEIDFPAFAAVSFTFRACCFRGHSLE